MTPGEKIAAIETLRDEAQRKLRHIKSLGGPKQGRAMYAYWRDLQETVQVMETLRKEVKEGK